LMCYCDRGGGENMLCYGLSQQLERRQEDNVLLLVSGCRKMYGSLGCGIQRRRAFWQRCSLLDVRFI